MDHHHYRKKEVLYSRKYQLSVFLYVIYLSYYLKTFDVLATFSFLPDFPSSLFSILFLTSILGVIKGASFMFTQSCIHRCIHDKVYIQFAPLSSVGSPLSLLRAFLIFFGRLWSSLVVFWSSFGHLLVIFWSSLVIFWSSLVIFGHLLVVFGLLLLLGGYDWLFVSCVYQCVLSRFVIRPKM